MNKAIIIFAILIAPSIVTTVDHSSLPVTVEAESIPVVLSNEQIVFNTCLDQGLDTLTSLLMVAQAKHETGNFKSKLFREHNNGFGLMYRYSWCDSPSYAVGPNARAEGRGGYASYCDLHDSTIDVIIFLKCSGGNKLYFNSAEQYVQWLKSIHYFEAPQDLYLKAIKRHFEKARNNLVTIEAK